MKKIILLILTVHCSLFIVHCQVPQAFKYQTVVRDSTGKLLVNEYLNFRISILRGGSSGSVVYSEIDSVKTNQLGLANLEIGKGRYRFGLIDTISWGNNTFFIKIEIQFNGILNYKKLGTSQILSVPYALYAEKTGVSGITGPTGNTGPTGPTGPTGAKIISENFNEDGTLTIIDNSGPKTTHQATWLTTGNTGIINPNNFIGPINNAHFVLKSFNTERMRILSSGPVLVNNTLNAVGDIFSSYTGGPTAGIRAISGYGVGSGSIGVFGQSSALDGYGMKAFNSNLLGTAFIAGGNNITTITTIGNGSGAVIAGNEVGSFSYATEANIGTGVMGVGNNIPAPTWYDLGSGGAFTGDYCGVYGEAQQQYMNLARGSFGGVFRAKGFVEPVGVAGWKWDGIGLSWVQYKIIGPGAVSTIVDGKDNNEVIMFCPEAPEVLLQDKGEGELINGKVHIALDPILTKNIYVDDMYPLSVLIQPEGDCKGVYVTNKTASGFDVAELQNGASNIKFTWFIIARRADKTYTDKDGSKMTSSYSKVRFPINNSVIVSKPVKVIKHDATLNK